MRALRSINLKSISRRETNKIENPIAERGKNAFDVCEWDLLRGSFSVVGQSESNYLRQPRAYSLAARDLEMLCLSQAAGEGWTSQNIKPLAHTCVCIIFISRALSWETEIKKETRLVNCVCRIIFLFSAFSTSEQKSVGSFLALSLTAHTWKNTRNNR